MNRMMSTTLSCLAWAACSVLLLFKPSGLAQSFICDLEREQALLSAAQIEYAREWLPANKYALIFDEGWMFVMHIPGEELCRDCGVCVFVATNGLVEYFHNHEPSWAFSLGKEITDVQSANDAALEVSKSLSFQYDPSEDYGEKSWRFMFVPKAPSAAPENECTKMNWTVYRIYWGPETHTFLRKKEPVFDEYIW